jgi:hypothetical protein
MFDIHYEDGHITTVNELSTVKEILIALLPVGDEYIQDILDTKFIDDLCYLMDGVEAFDSISYFEEV